ncbi:MAG: hypothetical protein R3183_05665 [Oleiphilaceae bacterium]|nr:hypothetical protein [Oleiphilaceae bacterium]
MLGINITKRLDEITYPVRNDIRTAQEKTLERIQRLFREAENEVQWKGQHLSPEQRMESAEKELEKAEEHLLSAISSMYKALCYVVPDVISRINILPMKEIKGELVVEGKPEAPRLESFYKGR